MATAEGAAFRRLAAALADAFDGEGRPGGDEASEALREVLVRAPPPAAIPDPAVRSAAEAALALPGALAIAPVVAAACGTIAWRPFGAGVERKPFSLGTVELIGPTGMAEHPRVRVGLFLQAPEVAYPRRVHAAEETYLVIGGSACWQVGDGPFDRRGAGAYVFHPSYAPHASRTGREPMIGAWRWTGDIRRETYALATQKT